MLTTSAIQKFLEEMEQANKDEFLFKLVCDTVYECGIEDLDELKNLVKESEAVAKMDAREEEEEEALGSED